MCERPSMGAPAPSVELLDAEGRPWRLAEQSGRPVLLIFHRHIH